MKKVLALVGLLWISSGVCHAQDPPNILVLLLDDVGIEKDPNYGVGIDLPTTPNLDALAAESVRFERFYSAPVCTASRAQLLTGRLGHQTGLGSNARAPGADFGLPLAEETIMEGLATAGYSSLCAGKWHLGLDFDTMAPLDAGCDDFIGFMYHHSRQTDPPHDYYNRPKSINGEVDDQWFGLYFPDRLTDEAIAHMEGMTGPKFVYMAYDLAHAPWQCPPAELIERTCDETTDSLAEIQLAMIEALDTLIARWLAAVDETWYVFVTSDNGSPSEVALDPVTPDRAKATLFEGGVRVPAYVRGPGIAPAVYSGGVGSLTDIWPTIAELAGVTPSSTIDGISLLPALETGAPMTDRLTSTEMWTPPGDQTTVPPASKLATSYGVTVTDGKYKGILQRVGLQPTVVGFYNLETDPWELNNLVDDPLDMEGTASFAVISDHGIQLMTEHFPWP